MRAFVAGLSVLVISACGGAATNEQNTDDSRETDTQSNQPAPAAPAPEVPAQSDEPGEVPASDDHDDPAPPFAGVGGLQDPGGAVACSEVGCLSGFQLAIDKQSAWQPGAYRFVARGDNGSERSCDLRLTAVDMLLYEGCDGFFMTRQDDSPVPASAQIQIVSDEVEVEVLLDGERIAFARYEPTWTEHRPNGPRCEPVCTNGDQQVLGIE
jgi:hypothetical protein